MLVEERLLEAEHFALELMRKRSLDFQFYLNAFLSAARSTTFLIQKEMSGVSGFDSFWIDLHRDMNNDEAMRFFLKLRNFSQKEGRVSIVGWSGFLRPRGHAYFYEHFGFDEPRFLYYFADGSVKVPESVKNDDVVRGALRHTGKLALVTPQVMSRFPFDTCPFRACCDDGLRYLGLSVEDYVTAAGFPAQWIHAMPSTFETSEALMTFPRD